MLQENIGEDDDEYTSGVYTGEDGEIKGICILKRELKDGYTYKAVRVIDRNLENVLHGIAKSTPECAWIHT